MKHFQKAVQDSSTLFVRVSADFQKQIGAVEAMKNARIFVHMPLLQLKPIRAAQASQNLPSDTKFNLTQSRNTLPLTVYFLFVLVNYDCSNVVFSKINQENKINVFI